MKKVTKIEENRNLQSTRPKLRVAAYCRVSTDSDAQLESLEAQKQHYENYITAHNDWTFAGLYFDEGISGTKKEKRPELNKLIQDCKDGKIDFIITKSISRFARNTTDCLDMVRTLLDLQIPIFFERENINTGSMESELFLAILSSMAESESHSISENNKWGIQKRFRDGTFKISYPPYGYDWNGTEMVINPVQAAVVKRIFAETLAGKGSQAIANELNAEAVPTKKGGRWSGTSIRGMLINEKYVGDVIFQKTYTDYHFNRHVNYGGKDQYMIMDHHEPIISREDFEAVAKMIAQHASEKGIQKGQEKYQNRYCFSGNIICSECGNTFKRRVHTCKEHKYIAWCCNTHLTDKDSCSMLYIRDDDLKISFLTMMNKLIYGHKQILRPLLTHLRNTNSGKSSTREHELQTLLLQNTEQRETLTKLMAQGYIDQVLYNKENNELLMLAENYKAEIDSIQKSCNLNSEIIATLSELLHFTEHSKMLTNFDESLFNSHVNKVIVYSRNEIGFKLKCGLTLKERI